MIGDLRICPKCGYSFMFCIAKKSFYECTHCKYREYVDEKSNDDTANSGNDGNRCHQNNNFNMGEKIRNVDFCSVWNRRSSSNDIVNDRGNTGV